MPVTISGSTGIGGNDGTVGTPAIKGSDNDSGLYFPSAGNVAIAINGTQALLVDNTGSVKINGMNVIAVTPGNDGNVMTSNGNSWISVGRITSGTANSSFGSTPYVDFTGIPSWVKRVTVMFNGVSTNGISPIQIQVGSGSISSTGYTSAAGAINGGTGQTSSSTGLPVTIGVSASTTQSGTAFLSLISNNSWVESGTVLYTGAAGAIVMSAGNSPALGGALDRVRITTVGGTDIFDAGSINILYE